MREAGDHMGYSSSYISQIENGRENPPTGDRLDKFLEAYGSTRRQFTMLSKQENKNDLELLFELLPKLKKPQISVVLKTVEALLGSKI